MSLLGDIFQGLWHEAQRSNDIRHASHGLSDDELRRRAVDAFKNKDFGAVAGYKSAYEDKHNK